MKTNCSIFNAQNNSISYERSYLTDQMHVPIDTNESINKGMKHIDQDVSLFVANLSHTINSNKNKMKLVVKLMSIALY
jgi:hypothetical protein